MSTVSELTAADKTLKIYPLLEVPSSSPHVGIKDPNFKKLTTAEKLNDRNYRKLVYQTYPNEPTCDCKSFYNVDDIKKSSSNLLICRSGCKNACCTRMRQSLLVVASNNRNNANKTDQVAPFVSDYCVGNKRDSVIRNVHAKDERRWNEATHNGDYCCGKNRLRGGGEGGEEERAGEKGMYPRSGKVSGTLVRWLDDTWNERNDCVVERRLDGGGGGCCAGYAESHPPRMSLSSRAPCYNEENLRVEYPRAKYSREHSKNYNFATSNLNPDTMNFSDLTNDSYGPVGAACCCPEKETFVAASTARESNRTSGKKSLPAVDGLVKALRETQAFVESLGKVPGLPGLGLMDPAESPYFGRFRNNELSNEETMRVAANVTGLGDLPNPQCTGPCNSRILGTTIGGTSGRSVGPNPFTIDVPGRGGVVREAVPSMPGPGLSFAMGKSHKNDDKDNKPVELDTSIGLPMDNEASPCGEKRCRARRRKSEIPGRDSAIIESDETAKKMIVTNANINGGKASKTSHRIKRNSKIHSVGKSWEMSGNGVERNRGKRSLGKGRRRMLNFVYSAGDIYSDETCGHKNCIEERHRVPGNMGWLWNLNETTGRLKPRPGWRPGAIGRRIREIFREERANFSHSRKRRTKSSRSASSSLASASSRSRSAPSRGKRSKAQGYRGTVKRSQVKIEEDDKEEIEPPPTLRIHRKDGTYYVTMYPIKQDTMDLPKLEEPMKPLQFKIAKNRDDDSIASSSTASDMEIEFSPPAAVNRYRKKPNVVHVDTQVKEHEINDAFKSDDAAGKVKDVKKPKKGKK